LTIKPLSDFGSFSMLTLTSRFVLQVLPYLLMALAAVVLLPGIADSLIAAAIPDAASSPRGIETMVDPFARGETAVDFIRQDHEAFAPNGLLREIATATEPYLGDR
jgi:hypothetical protein